MPMLKRIKENSLCSLSQNRSLIHIVNGYVSQRKISISSELDPLERPSLGLVKSLIDTFYLYTDWIRIHSSILSTDLGRFRRFLAENQSIYSPDFSFCICISFASCFFALGQCHLLILERFYLSLPIATLKKCYRAWIKREIPGGHLHHF